MFYPKSNNNSNGVNVNTTLFTSYSDVAMVVVGGWNKQLSIKVYPATGKDASGLTQYVQEQSQIIITSLTQEKAISFWESYVKEVKPAVEKKEAKKVSIPVGKEDSFKVLSVGFDGTDAYLEIALNVDASGVSHNVIKHKFNKITTTVDYNPETGAGVDKVIEGELESFMNKVEFAKFLSPIIAHSINYNNANKAAYAARNQGNSGNGGSSYQAPVNGNGNMDDYLPFN